MFAVLIDVTVVVDDEEVVGDQSVGDGTERDGQCPLASLQIVGETYRHDAEEDENQEVAHGDVGEEGGVEETEHDTGDTDADKPPTTKVSEWQSNETGDDGDYPQCTLHGLRGDPSRGDGSFGPEAFFIVRAFEVVVVVVGEVGVDLHHESEGDAEDEGQPMEAVAHVMKGEHTTDQHGSKRTRERLRANSLYPFTFIIH